MSLKDQWNDLGEKIQEQEWYQQGQAAFQQLPPEQQKIVKWGSLAAVAGVVLYFSFLTMAETSTLKQEYFEKQELLQTINQAGEEMRRLKGQNAGMASDASGNWLSVLQGIASNEGVPAEAVTISTESPGPSQSAIQESLLQVEIKSVQIRQLNAMLYQIENSSTPMKIKGLTVKVDPKDSRLNAQLNLSAFMPKKADAKK